MRTFTKKRYRYVGKEKDLESGLYYYGARYYAAWTCRFISVDPLAPDYPFYTPYNYAGNKPINKIDIDGMQEENAESIPGVPESNNQNTENELGSTDNIIPPLTEDLNPTIGDQLKGEWIHPQTGDKYTYDDKKWFVLLPDIIVSSNKQNNVEKNPTESSPQSSENQKSNTPWMKTAFNELNAGVKEEPKGSNSGPRVDVYLKSAGASSPNAWCASFVHWCLAQNGIKGAGAKGANYSDWGIKLDKPAYGAIAIFTTGHVGFVAGETKSGKLVILHGNWSDRVDLSKYGISKSEIKEYRYPSKYNPSYNLPKY